MDRNAKVTVIARAVHEAIRGLQAAFGEKEAPPWEASGWMQESSVEGVEFALSNPTPGAQHDAWCAAKRRDGWRHGAVKDEKQKTHPSLVPFEQLDHREQLKDALLIAIVQGMAGALELSSPAGTST
jgi:hypothetical protein